VTENACIASEEFLSCFLCGKAGTPLYQGLHDRLFGAPGEWGFLKCAECGLVWLNPRPIPADLDTIYKRYYTHGENGRSVLRQKSKRALYSSVPGYGSLAPNWLWKILGRGLALSSLLKERALLGTMCLVGTEKGRLLDVGCGGGLFLSIMRDAGWQAVGVEPDRAAARQAQQRYGLSVFSGHLMDAKFDDQSFDAITLNHVIEHALDPVALLSECRRLLNFEGRVVVVTPNWESEGHRILKSSWRGLEPPRHIHVFSQRALRSCCERAGLRVRLLRTSEQSAAWICASSQATQYPQNGLDAGLKWGMQLSGLLFQLRERRMLRTLENAGEELVVIADRSETSKDSVPIKQAPRARCAHIAC